MLKELYKICSGNLRIKSNKPTEKKPTAEDFYKRMLEDKRVTGRLRTNLERRLTETQS